MTFLQLARLRDPVPDKERTATILRSLPELLMAFTLLADATNREYDQVISLVRSEMDRKTHRPNNNTASKPKDRTHPYPATKKTPQGKRQRPKPKKKGMICWSYGRIGHIRSGGWRQTRKTFTKSTHQGGNKKNNINGS